MQCSVVLRHFLPAHYNALLYVVNNVIKTFLILKYVFRNAFMTCFDIFLERIFSSLFHLKQDLSWIWVYIKFAQKSTFHFVSYIVHQVLPWKGILKLVFFRIQNHRQRFLASCREALLFYQHFHKTPKSGNTTDNAIRKEGSSWNPTARTPVTPAIQHREISPV